MSNAPKDHLTLVQTAARDLLERIAELQTELRDLRRAWQDERASAAGEPADPSSVA